MGYILFYLLNLAYPIFSNVLSVGRLLDILKYCGLGRSNPAVVTTGGVLATG